jgi:lactate dehydrogenase-like 2-hydroxyacid dehydrogenase
MRVLITFPQALAERALIRLDKFDVAVVPPETEDDARLLAALGDAEGVLITPRTRVDRSFLSRAPKLRAVSTYSVGLDHIDLAAADERGVAVAHTPTVLTDAVADLVIGLILMLARRLPEAMAVGASGDWRDVPMGIDPRGKVLFIVGFGRIGQEVARRALAFKMKITWFDQKAPQTPIYGTTRVLDLKQGLSDADFVSVNLDLNASTRHIIGRDALACMKPTAYLVNTSRGPVIDQAALTETLKRRRIAGAALDVLEQEPPSPDDPILKLDNVIILPHIGTATTETRQAMLDCAIDNLIVCLRGEPCQFLATLKR